MYKSEVLGRGGISAKVVADSISTEGKRITTFELEYPRFIHAEFMTHRLFSRNSASSRAIPVKKILERIKEKPAMPIHWGKNQPGMSADEECDNRVFPTATYLALFEGHDGSLSEKEIIEMIEREGFNTKELAWRSAMGIASHQAEEFDKAGYHKQIVNRLTEPFQFIKVVCTATEFDNFFALRCHKAAQPEIQELASCMYKALQESVPFELDAGEWHLPYYQGNYGDGIWKPSGYAKWTPDVAIELDHKIGFTLEEAQKISASCCAQVSYRTLDTSVEKALKIYDALVNSQPVHASPFEHQATPLKDKFWCAGATHRDKYDRLWSGNFQGWIQYRQLLKDHTVWKYNVD